MISDEHVFEVHVRPGGRRGAVGGSHDGRLAVRVVAQPVDGEANRAVCKALANALDIRRSAVEIVGGETSRRKRVRVLSDPVRAAARVEELREG